MSLLLSEWFAASLNIALGVAVFRPGLAWAWKKIRKTDPIEETVK